MQVRLANEGDLPQLRDLSREYLEAARPHLKWDEAQAHATFWSYMDQASPTIWVAGTSSKIVGFLVADMYDYRVAKGTMIVMEVLYVAPAHRGGRAAHLLMKELLAWSQAVGAKEIISGNDNKTDSDRTAKFLQKYGFERVGYAMRLV